MAEEIRDEDKLLNTKQAAQLLGLAPATLHGYRCEGTGPPYIKMGGAVRYRRSSLENWIDECETMSTGKPERDRETIQRAFMQIAEHGRRTKEG